jgi:XRE family aerobic/anaerobic benzoate catabolism transcriptional regulator
MNEITNFRGQAVDSELSDEQRSLAFVARVGERVRKARQRKGIARRVVSELSGVSQRYLALLESGKGNISIALLHRVAEALDHRVEWLVGEEDPWESEGAKFATLFAGANAEQRAQVRRILQGDDARRRQRICLTGLRGAGKSTLGRLLGEKLNLPFVELNRDIEEQSGMPVDEVIALYGPEGYRRLERQALERTVAKYDAVVLAAAGGIVSEPETYAFLLANFHCAWLRASPEEHMQRVREQGDVRPMAGNPKAMDDLRSILTSREALYAKAELAIDTSGQTIAQSLDALVRALRNLPAA